MGYISDEAIEKVTSEIIVNRAKRREIQSLTKDGLQRYLVNLYRVGFEDGADAIKKYLEEKVDAKAENDVEEISIGWEDVLSVIAEVKGIGPKMLKAIDEKLKEAY